MPLQELSRPPAVTGLGDLGGVLQEAARGYATEKRQDQNRMNRLADTETELKFRARQAMIASLRAEGLLNPGDENDETKIATAYKEFKDRGLEKLYDEMLHTPGPDGIPFLTPDDLNNPATVAEAKVRFGQQKAAKAAFALKQPELQQEDFTRIRKEEAKVIAQMSALSAELERSADYVPSDAEIQNAALALARQLMKPGKLPSKDEIEAQRPAAVKELRELGMQRQFMDKQLKTVQLKTLTDQLQAIRAQAQAYITHGIGPSILQEPTAALAPTTPPEQADATPIKSFQERLAAGLEAGKAKAAATSPGAAAIQDPTTAPNYTYSGGILGGVERAVPAVAAGASRLAEVPGRIDRALGAVGQGILTGDFSVPKKGGLQTIGESAGTLLSGAFSEGERRVEDTVLREQPNSERARQILMRRGIRPPTSTSLADGTTLTEPFASPGLTPLNDGTAWWRTMPERL